MRARGFCAALCGGLIALSGCSVERFLNDTETVYHGEEFSLNDGKAAEFYLAKNELYEAVATDCWIRFQGDVGTPPEGSAAGACPTEVGVDSSGRLTIFLNTGIAYVDHKCEAYFAALRRVQRDFNATTSQVAIAGGAAAGVLGLLQASATEIAILATGTAAATASIESLRDRLIYQVDAADTKQLVRKAQEKYLDELPTADIADVPTAMIAIRAYAELCTPDQIEVFVVQAIKSGEAQSERAPAGAASESTAAAFGRSIADALSLAQSVGSDDLARLYWLRKLGGEEEESERAAIRAGMAPALAERVFDANGGVSTAFRENRKVDSLLDSLGLVSQPTAARAATLKAAASGTESTGEAATSEAAGTGEATPATPPSPPDGPAASSGAGSGGVKIFRRPRILVQ